MSLNQQTCLLELACLVLVWVVTGWVAIAPHSSPWNHDFIDVKLFTLGHSIAMLDRIQIV